MKSIKEVCPTVIHAIEAMIWGLENIPNDRYTVNMNVFSTGSHNVCYGCAATYATLALYENKQDIIPDTFYNRTNRAKPLGIDRYDLEVFEYAIDHFRIGIRHQLFGLYGENVPEFQADWCLDNENWQTELEKVKVFLSKLKESKNAN